MSVKYLFEKYEAIQFYNSGHLQPSLGNGGNSFISCSIMLSSPFSYFSAHDVSRLPQPNEASDLFLLFQRFYGSSISWEITSYFNQSKYRDTKISYLMQIRSQPRSMWKCLSQTLREFRQNTPSSQKYSWIEVDSFIFPLCPVS